MAPTKDIIITIPTLEGMVAALIIFHRTVVDLLLDYNILFGCTLILFSFYTKKLSKSQLYSAIVQDLYHPPVRTGAAQSYGAVEVPGRVKLNGVREKEMGCCWRIFSWMLFLGGIFVMIPTE